MNINRMGATGKEKKKAHLNQWFSELVSESLGGLPKISLLGPTPEILIQEVWDGDPRIHISNKFQNDADAAGL